MVKNMCNIEVLINRVIDDGLYIRSLQIEKESDYIREINQYLTGFKVHFMDL